ncbi:MAG: flagellar hook-associated protein FlgK [Marinisporobacter sp.]|jgi:flagellar hook-associated protein 1 FlgK|nr:flagellar hook-associated protein FlgK [Marinisporobacter sp.]
MSGSFFGLNIARSALFASQRAMQIVGHNIANANTPGYSRQRLNVSESNPIGIPGGQGMQGTGVDTKSIQQMRDAFLDFKIRKEFTTSGEWESKAEALKQIEAIFNEPSESGIRKVMSEFFSSLEELSKGEKADDRTVRVQVRQKGIAFANALNHMYNQLSDMQQNTDFAVDTTVNQINGYAEEIAKLNKQISTHELDGSRANDLRDQRNLLIDKLSKLVDIDVKETPKSNSKNLGTDMYIMLGGNILVSNRNYNALKATSAGQKNNYLDKGNLLEIKWENGSPFSCSGGKLKGLLDMRDNIDGKEKGIPYYMDQLNRFTTTFAARFNMQHGQGYGLAGSGNHIPFFNYPKLDYAKGDYGYEDVTASLTGSSDEAKVRNFEEANPGYTIFKVVQDKINTADNKLGGDPPSPVDFASKIGSNKLKLNGVDVELNNLKALGDGYDAAGNLSDVKEALQKDLDAEYDGNKHGGATFVVKEKNGKLVITSDDKKVDLTGTDTNITTALGYTTPEPDGDRWYKVKMMESKNLDISEQIDNDPNNIAAASKVDGNGNGLSGDGNNALKLNQLKNDPNMFAWGSCNDFFQSIVSNLGVDSQGATRMVDNQEVLIKEIDNKRQSISGVSLDEEMTHMIKFQQSYNAAARMITTFDEMLDKIINGMGVVGR